MFKSFCFCCCFLFCLNGVAQNTVGVLSFDEDLSEPGYNLFFSHNQSSVYLIDACGQIVHDWIDDSDFRPGNSVYLLENGNLVKCKRGSQSTVTDPIWAGGGGETVEVRNWDNEILASITINDSISRLHHDVAPLPNGNILMITWEVKRKDEALANGRNPALMDQDEVWSLVVLEWNPGADSIVWEWDSWDHLIQNFDANLLNFGEIGTNPGLIDVNYTKTGNPDWLHTNAIDYNPVLDQIVLSIPNFDELWIIDHSTTKEEASTSQGGNANKGGNLLYRWGNPKTYEIGDSTFQKLHFQHDVHWIDPHATSEDEDFGKVILYNNRLPDLTSSINIIQTPVKDFNYDFLERGDFGPEEFDRVVKHPDNNIQAFSNSVSSAQVLSNGNILAFSGRWGYAYELTESNKIAWEYRVPIKAGLPVDQGDVISISDNLTFRMNRYPLNYPAFTGKLLEPKDYLESNPDISFCDRLVNTSDAFTLNGDVIVFPNPTDGVFTVTLQNNVVGSYSIVDISGRERKAGNIETSDTQIDISNLSSGIYFLRLDDSNFHKIVKY